MFVYRFGVKRLDNVEEVMTQMRHGHDYANDLVAIERGRRSALLAVDDTPEVRAALEALEAARKTKATSEGSSSRKEALKKLQSARKAARGAAADELARIQELDAQIRLAARAITPAYWGTYLTVEESAQRQRKMPLYEDDAVTPALPRFRRWQEEGQVGIQIQQGLTTAEVRQGGDTRVRLLRSDRKVHGGPRALARGRVTEYADLWVRVASDGNRAPVWAVARVVMERQIPDAARWKYVRISRRREGRAYSWTIEITVETDRPARTLDDTLAGVVAVEPCWVDRGNDVLVCARTRTDQGEASEITLPTRIVGALRKAASIRSIRDQLTNALREELPALIDLETCDKPAWLLEARASLQLWKSPDRFYALLARWGRERYELAREAYDRLDAWAHRDDHLWRYEADSRGQALRSRNDFYRCLAAGLSRSFRHVVVPNRDYRREARFGPDADLRFLVSPHALTSSLEAAFDSGTSLYLGPWDKGCDWLEGGVVDGKPCAGACERFATSDPAVTVRRVKTETKKGGAWAARKAAKAEKAKQQAQPGS